MGFSTDPRFDVGPDGNKGIPNKRPKAVFPGYNDTGFGGKWLGPGVNRDGIPYVIDAPKWAFNPETDITICAVCEWTTPQVSCENIISCINMKFYDFPKSANDPRDGNFYPYWADPGNNNPPPAPGPGGFTPHPGDTPGPAWPGPVQ